MTTMTTADYAAELVSQMSDDDRRRFDRAAWARTAYALADGYDSDELWKAVEAEVAREMPDDTIRALRTESGEAGDLEQVAICDAALKGDLAARVECQRVVADAAAQDDY